MESRDFQRIKHIKLYCEDIAKSIARFGNDFEIFSIDNDYFNSVSMSVFQIGELSVHLTDKFKEDTKNQIPWVSIRGMRNMYAHEYSEMKKSLVWLVAIEEIPKILLFCNDIIEQNESIN